jgi:hypothetical protein
MAMMLAAALLMAQGHEVVWIESENPVSANVKPGIGFPGRPELLSGGKWLTITGEVPAEGALLTYAFSAPSGHRELWHRVGFEAARSPFEWSIDGGDWHRVAPHTPTLDLTELADWNGVAWMDMGPVALNGSEHKLAIRIPQPKGNDKNVLYGSDAFALADGPFHPNGKWKPAEAPCTPRDEAAASHVFEVADTAGPDRQTIPLDGDWEIARDDEIAPALAAMPMSPLDPNPVWSAIAVPGDKA